MPSPKDPNKYIGPNVYTGTIVKRNRRPGLPDYRQPETGKNYEIGCIWQVAIDPSSGVYGEMWLLTKIVANQGYWIMLSTGSGPGPIETLLVQAATAPGTVVVVQDGSGQISISGAVVAAHSIPLETRSRAQFSLNIEAQIASLVSPTPGNTNSVGLACYNTNQFQLDTTSGMVSLKGSTTGAPVLSTTGDDAVAVVPSATGTIDLFGRVVANATHAKPVFVVNSAANTESIDVQIAIAVVPTPANTNSAGLACFNNTMFTVNSTSGMVGLYGGAAVCAFFAYVASDVNNVTGDDTFYHVVFGSTRYDIGSNFNTTTGVFTAPKTGVYQFNCALTTKGLAVANTTGKGIFLYNNTDQLTGYRSNFSTISDAGGNFQFSFSMSLQMTAGDTMAVAYDVAGGTKIVGLFGSSPADVTNFNGFLIA